MADGLTPGYQKRVWLEDDVNADRFARLLSTLKRTYSHDEITVYRGLTITGNQVRFCAMPNNDDELFFNELTVFLAIAEPRDLTQQQSCLGISPSTVSGALAF